MVTRTNRNGLFFKFELIGRHQIAPNPMMECAPLERGGPRPVVATKAGRRLNPHVTDGYTKANIEAFIDRSRENLGVDTLDLVQLHCPPTDVYFRPQLFDGLNELVAKGKLKHYGVSVERVA